LSLEEIGTKMLAASREIRKREYKIICPVCGKMQYRMSDGGSTSFVCGKCNTERTVTIFNGCMVYIDPASEEEE